MMDKFNVLVFRLNQLIEDKINPERKKIGFSKGQPKVLRYLTINDGASQIDIANNLDIRPATISRILDGLENKGYIHRESGDDRRSLKIFITDEGREKFEKWDAVLNVLIDEMLDGLSKKEKQELNRLLVKVIQNLKD